MSQLDLARLLNVSDRSVGFYENGQRDPDTDTLNKLADIFECSIDYILGRNDERNYSNKKEIQPVNDFNKDEFIKNLSNEDQIVIHAMAEELFKKTPMADILKSMHKAIKQADEKEKEK
jgi:transcriptional regulator with XRE-family HTH domain